MPNRKQIMEAEEKMSVKNVVSLGPCSTFQLIRLAPGGCLICCSGPGVLIPEPWQPNTCVWVIELNHSGKILQALMGSHLPGDGVQSQTRRGLQEHFLHLHLFMSLQVGHKHLKCSWIKTLHTNVDIFQLDWKKICGWNMRWVLWKQIWRLILFRENPVK